ncbi:MAG: hypothetical protein U1A72_23255 [Sulfuritalea sp.]|nr:hypothetical protein [Sulfuritalea sp.]
MPEFLFPLHDREPQQDVEDFHRLGFQWLELTELQADARPSDYATTAATFENWTGFHHSPLIGCNGWGGMPLVYCDFHINNMPRSRPVKERLIAVLVWLIDLLPTSSRTPRQAQSSAPKVLKAVAGLVMIGIAFIASCSLTK